MTDRVGDVVGRDVPEHLAEKDEIGRDRARVGIGDRRIPCDHLHPIEAGG